MRRKYRMKRHAVAQPLDPSYKIIPLTKGQNALVDAADYERLSKINWYAQWSEITQSFYARSFGLRMAREVIGCGVGELADHINHDTLDNRRKNLRKCTRLRNACNRRLQSVNKSGFKGVCWNRAGKKWRSKIGFKGKSIFLGHFNSAKEAAKAYDKAAKNIHGEFAFLNFPH